MPQHNSDPYLFLEDLDSPETRTFIETAHAKTLADFAQSERFHFLTDDITALLQDDRQIQFCQEHRGRMYHFWQSAAHPKGVYRVCSAASYRAGIPEWQVLFDVADFDEILDDDVYLDGVSHYVEQPERCLVSLSVAGSDTAYTVEFDLSEGKIVEGGFHFPAGKSRIAWRDADSVWVCPAWDERQLTRSGYPREVWLMRRGQSFEEAQPVYRIAEDGVMVGAWRYLDGQGAPVDLIDAMSGFFTHQYFQVNSRGETLPLNLPADCEMAGYLAGQLLLHLKSEWHRANQSYPAGSLVAVKLSRGALGEAQLLFAPSASQALEAVETTRHFVLASLLDNVSGCLKAWKWANGRWQEHALPPLPQHQGSLDITDQPWGGDVVYLAAGSFLSPLTLYALDLGVSELSVLRRQPEQFDTHGITVAQHFAVSADGTRVPYFWVGSKRQPETPTLIYAYGGFAVAEPPYYLGSIGRHWLAEGKSFVLANIRGGGEFSRWHEAAQRENKHKSVDDLLAVLHDLQQRGYTSPEKTAIQGGSNGGLIVASAMVRQPESMAAVVCEVPLTDMLRYADLSAGASWIEEYGNPADTEMHRYLSAFSPYHQLGGRSSYPCTLLTTSLSDDRVHPAHALKFYAKLHNLQDEKSWLYAPPEGGHTGNGTQEQTAEDLACILCFLEKVLDG